MKTYPINEARAEFSALVDRALAGEPTRVTSNGKEAVVIVSEEAWCTRMRPAPTLGALLALHARAGTFGGDVAELELSNRPWSGRFVDLPSAS